MKILVSSEAPLSVITPALALLCYEEAPPSASAAAVDEQLGGIIARLRADGEFSGSANSVKIIYTFGKIAADRVVLVGLGKKEGLSPERYRQGAGSMVKQLKNAGIKKCAVVVDEEAGLIAPPFVEGSLLGGYSFNQYKKKPEKRVAPDEMLLLVGPGAKETVEQSVKESVTVAEAACLARDLVSQPGNSAIPQYLADQAQELSRNNGFNCTVLEREELEKKGMGALIAVGKGSHNPPKMVILEYNGGSKGERPVALVGKGITFDSGGISLKPREGMEKMKNDMAGAAAVLGVFKAAVSLRVPVNIIGLLPLAENLPGGGAYKPGDVIKAMSGATIEVVNTDAEGRLILCDALHFARQFQPKAIIDIATLTGACVVALGSFATGIMGNDEALIKKVQEAGERTGERVWELPLWDEYGEVMESDIADMKNAGGTSGATISAAWFLKQYVEDTPWAHLDIAGTAWEDKGRPYLPKGATGVGVRLLVDYLRNL